jgi:hypothetical protein
MIVFKTPSCLSKLNPADPSYSLVKKLIDRLVDDFDRARHRWIFDWDGGFLLITPADVASPLTEFHPGLHLHQILFEGVHVESSHYVAVSLLNNQATLTWIFPDASWLPSDLRDALKANLIPTPTNSTI